MINNLNVILDIVNIVCQIIVAVSAIIAIIITIKQVNNRGKINLKTRFRVSERIGFDGDLQAITKREDFVHEPCISISIFNNGISKVFINSIGMACKSTIKGDKRKITGEYVSTDDEFVIGPGEFKSVSLGYLEAWLDGNKNVKETDEIYVVVNYNMDKTRYYKTTYTFGSIIKDWRERVKRIEKDDSKFFDKR